MDRPDYSATYNRGTNSAEQCALSVWHHPAKARLGLTLQKGVLSEKSCGGVLETVAQLLAEAASDNAPRRPSLAQPPIDSAPHPSADWKLWRSEWINTTNMISVLSAHPDVSQVTLHDATDNEDLYFHILATGSVDSAALRYLLKVRQYHVPGLTTKVPLSIDPRNTGQSVGAIYDRQDAQRAALCSEVLLKSGLIVAGDQSWCEAGGRYLDLPGIQKSARNHGLRVPRLSVMGSAAPLRALLQSASDADVRW